MLIRQRRPLPRQWRRHEVIVLESGPSAHIAAFLYFDLSFKVWVMLGPLGVQIAKDLGLTALWYGYIETSLSTKRKTAEIIAQPAYINTGGT
jgi:hypothetical protein